MSIVTLVDATTGASARLAVDQGFNLFDFQVPVKSGRLSVLWSADGFETGQQRASSSGIPILFPFPGRIAKGEYTWQDRTWNLPLTDRMGNAIHGYVFNRPWKLISQSDATVTGNFHASRDLENWNHLWPADFRITATYRLQSHQLIGEYHLENAGDAPLPYGFGTHPYFRVPLGGTRADDCLVTLPVRKEWELEALIATGAVRDVVQPFASGVPFGSLQLDNVFGGLEFHQGRCICSITDPSAQRTLELEFGSAFRELVVYNPPHREAICIEPYTCVPGATHLTSTGLDLGWKTLAPGALETLEMIIRVRDQANS